MHKTINYCESFMWCHLDEFLFIFSAIRFFIIFTLKLDSLFIYLFSKTLLNWSSFPIHHLLIERRVKTWNFIININIFLSYEIVFIVIHLCELFEELSKLVIQLRFVILNNLSHNAKLCKTIHNSRFWNLFPSGC